MELEKVIVLETSVDHITGEEIGNALTMLNSMAEILDALYIPALGKKNRPVGIFQVLCLPDVEEKVVAALFKYTHALGIRRRETERYVLPRDGCTVTLAGETVKAKRHFLEDIAYVRPEADDVAALARKCNLGMPALRFHEK